MGARNSSRAALHRKLAIDITEMALDRGVGDNEFLGNFLVAQPRRNQMQNLLLALA